MHKLNFCRDLCLPVKDIDGSRGLNIVGEFPEAVVMPMAGIATPFHALYVARPIKTDLEYKTSEILMIQDLDAHEKVHSLLSNPNYLVVAPDHALDTSSLTDIVFKTREDSLKQITEGLFRKGFEKVVIWANNGIGNNSKRGEDGVVRDERGVAYSTIVGGKEENFYQRGLTTTYQNSAHQHIHIAPTSSDKGFDSMLVPALESLHDKSHKANLEKYREMIGQDENYSYIPCISVAVLDSKTGIPSSPIEFTHYVQPYTLAGLARTIITNHSSIVQGLDMSNKETKKRALTETAELYSAL